MAQSSAARSTPVWPPANDFEWRFADGLHILFLHSDCKRNPRRDETAGAGSLQATALYNYGVKQPCFGVSIGDLKKFQKRIKKLPTGARSFDTGN